MKKTRVLVVDDEADITRLLRSNLESEGYEVCSAGDGEEALRTFRQMNPDLVILDIRMPRMDGFTVCRHIRELGNIPVIMLTALGSEDDKVKAFDLGADDYVSKPFEKRVLLARVRAVLRRTLFSEECLEPALHFHELTIDCGNHRVTLGDDEIILSGTEYRLLLYLARNAERVLSFDQILAKVWGEPYIGETHLLQVNMARLRQKLKDDAKKPRFISTRPGIGYILLKNG